MTLTRSGRIRALSAAKARSQRQRVARLKRTTHGPQRCQWPEGCGSEACDPHESLSRARGGDPLDPDWLLCREHHDAITSASGDLLAWAKSAGLIRSAPPRSDIASAFTCDTVPDVAKTERQQIAVRLPAELLAKIDERAGRHKRSRNEWIELALTRVVDMPSQITQRQERF